MAAMTAPTLDITPADALIDVPRRIAITGLRPGETVAVSTRTVRGRDVAWASQADFIAAGDGSVDLERDAPVRGSYDGVAPMGLLWAQRPVGSDSRELFHTDATRPLVTEITVTAAGGEARSELVQRLAAAGVVREDIRVDGLVGTLYRPPGAGPHPAVMVLNGSGGGINEPRAALYASHGYAALALGYFKAPGLSDYISDTPLEYFERGLQWMHRELRPAHGFVALSGQSRGGELVLLLGATFPDLVSAVVGYVPGAVVHSAQNAADPAIGREGAAWLHHGKPLPHVWENNPDASWAPFDEGPAPHRHERAILTALKNAEAVARARIRVEHIRGPVMLLSGTDDGSWPSSLYSRMVADKLAETSHPYPVEHLDFEHAGHAILFPYVPTTQAVYAHPVSRRISTTGGTPEANAGADEASWRGVRAFLARAVAARKQAAGN
ncbi:acyl-CoA thioesterase/BAAT N-terminal domain-containing protein [Cupriavidus necator]|nr:acyl-CoA thioesterase/BAAT N-terminal domain-containing protein [Cupriavidus necator]